MTAVYVGENRLPGDAGRPEGTWLTLHGERFIGIRNVQAMNPFLMSLVSLSNLWLFAGSNGSFTAGRGDADHAIFPYLTVDKILNQSGAGGARSLFLVERENGLALWEPWQNTADAYHIRRNLYKSEYGTSIIFEEINEDLGLRFAWALTTSEAFGLVRCGTLENLKPDPMRIRYLDGWEQLIPPGVGRELFERNSYLAAAYMRHECQRGLGIFTLNSGITDRAEPCESLRAAAAWAVGHAQPVVLLSGRQIENFRHGLRVHAEAETRGQIGAFLVCDTVDLQAFGTHEWFTVADTGLDHAALVKLQNQRLSPAILKESLASDVAATRDALKERIAAADGLQQTADASMSVHHFANVLFNCMRGGTLPDGYRFPTVDLAEFLRQRNVTIHARHTSWLKALPAQLDLDTLRQHAAATGDPQLVRLAREYLPLTFSRRHGDPSRPWNRFSIRTRDDSGNIIYDYQGNWRDIFQNWESLAQSYPGILSSLIAIFLNASTADGYNPYRISRAGIDWEQEDPSDPWSHIGYWGDHQIIYLLRLLESSERFEPGQLARDLNAGHFSHARVPYELQDFPALLRDPRHSVRFNAALHQELLARAKAMGNDGKLCAGKDGEVLRVSLGEKLLVPLLAKLSNFVPGGGLWLNTQRPEWNDANNALAGWGLSVVTVCSLRRYLIFLDQVFASAGEPVVLSPAVARFARQIADSLAKVKSDNDDARFEVMAALGEAGWQHRQSVYQGDLGGSTTLAIAEVRDLFAAALGMVEATLRANRRPDGMFHSYNLLKISGQKAAVSHLQLMLEGQVAILSSGFLKPAEALSLLQALRQSDLFRADQHSYLLYPDHAVAPFLARNTLPPGWQTKIPAIAALTAMGDRNLLITDENGDTHFQGDLANTSGLEARLNQLSADEHWTKVVVSERPALLELWEEVFEHAAFTGRSGTMFAFEGLGSIYWHMVAKLLLEAAACHQQAVETGAPAEVMAGLREAYYDIRRGLGLAKPPEVYGAFPTDPYSHSPRHLGAQQPGMTGQVKEEILIRWAELGVQVQGGRLTFAPRLLRRAEFFNEPHEFIYVDVAGTSQSWKLPSESLAFTYCQVPVCYCLSNTACMTVTNFLGGDNLIFGRTLPAADSKEVFARSGEVARIMVHIPRNSLSDERPK